MAKTSDPPTRTTYNRTQSMRRQPEDTPKSLPSQTADDSFLGPMIENPAISAASEPKRQASDSAK